MTDLVQSIVLFCLTVLTAGLLGAVLHQARKLDDLEHILEIIGGRSAAEKAGIYTGNPVYRADDKPIVHKHTDINSGGRF